MCCLIQKIARSSPSHWSFLLSCHRRKWRLAVCLEKPDILFHESQWWVLQELCIRTIYSTQWLSFFVFCFFKIRTRVALLTPTLLGIELKWNLKNPHPLVLFSRRHSSSVLGEVGCDVLVVEGDIVSNSWKEAEGNKCPRGLSASHARTSAHWAG